MFLGGHTLLTVKQNFMGKENTTNPGDRCVHGSHRNAQYLIFKVHEHALVQSLHLDAEYKSPFSSNF